MPTINLPSDFKEFLKLFNQHHVEYLLIGGYAVAFHGYSRATADMDVWVAVNPDNARRIVTAIIEFGFNVPELSEKLFLEEGPIIRMGVPPLRIEIWTDVTGLCFEESFPAREIVSIDGLEVNVIDLINLKINKKASGRNKDLDDLENLP
jgi:predicted nucleotidyltransferase